jgi:hypothetical protein
VNGPPPKPCPGSAELFDQMMACFCEHCADLCPGICGEMPTPDHRACQACADEAGHADCKAVAEACAADDSSSSD